MMAHLLELRLLGGEIWLNSVSLTSNLTLCPRSISRYNQGLLANFR
jgi:hypothetical protein